MLCKYDKKTLEMLLDLGFEADRINRGYIKLEDALYRILQRVKRLERTHDASD
jgi:hypothetical protein